MNHLNPFKLLKLLEPFKPKIPQIYPIVKPNHPIHCTNYHNFHIWTSYYNFAQFCIIDSTYNTLYFWTCSYPCMHLRIYQYLILVGIMLSILSQYQRALGIIFISYCINDTPSIHYDHIHFYPHTHWHGHLPAENMFWI